MKPIVPIAAAAAPAKRPDTNRGYSAEVWAAFRLAIIDSSNVDLTTDAVHAAIDAVDGDHGHCVCCEIIEFSEKEKPAAFAVLRRAGGYEPPIARGICATCSRRFDHADLRYRALEAVDRGPGR